MGKTTLLESIALPIVWGSLEASGSKGLSERVGPFVDLLLRTGEEHGSINANYQVGIEQVPFSLTLFERGRLEGKGSVRKFLGHDVSLRETELLLERSGSGIWAELFGVKNDPLLLPFLLYFHSLRRVQHGNPELGMMIEGRRRVPPFRRPDLERSSTLNAFKISVLRALMAKSELFERMYSEHSEESLIRLNELVERYVGGKLEKVRPSGDNTIDIRVSRKDGSSISFDSLSSGQKEIISTLT
ncbi:MAG: hypothetical protein IPK53_18735 [bacterium]|nr:hypothetical protein [bacterium]